MAGVASNPAGYGPEGHDVVMSAPSARSMIQDFQHSAYSESVRRRRVRGGMGRARPVRLDAGPKRPVVDRSTSRSQNDFNLHDFPLTR